MAKKSFKCVNVEEDSFNQLGFICNRLNMKKSVFMHLLLENVFDIFSNLKKGAGITFDSSGNKLIIISYGKPMVITGTFQMPTSATDKECDAEVKKLCESAFDAQNKEKV